MDPVQKTFFVVEIGGADFHFEKLHDASEFFAKIVGSTGEKISRIGYSGDFYYKDGKQMPTMKQEILAVYPSKKAAEFAKSQVPEKED